MVKRTDHKVSYGEAYRS